ncbi:5'-3' exoribonuclease [Nymphaea thermarum]|nr:5'-3' exoribonuclease [Nymphaea thermarum]
MSGKLRTIGVTVVGAAVVEAEDAAVMEVVATVVVGLLEQVKVLALTDHDTMAGIPEAIEAARKYGMRIIPGVEISAMFSPREDSGTEEPVHILAYYGSCGPSRFEELEKCLGNIRDGRYMRAKDILLKLKNLKMPLKWEHVARIAGNGVAPGRVHVARAMVEAGHVENLKQAFSRYLYDGGPAYATGNELLAEEAVQLIHRTGGIAALAHPWALKNPGAVIKSLKGSGLHAIEVYRSDGKLAVADPSWASLRHFVSLENVVNTPTHPYAFLCPIGLGELADLHGLVKLGGSDFHGRGGHDESDLGTVNLSVLAVQEFLKLARPIWCDALKDVLLSFAEEPSESSKFKKFRNHEKDVVSPSLRFWLTDEERQTVEMEAMRLKLSHIVVNERGIPISVIGK